MKIWKNTAAIMAVCATLLTANMVQADEKVPEDILDYDTALRCAALHLNFAEANNDDKTVEEFHDDIGTRWTVMALLRDESKMDAVEKDLIALVQKLDGRLEEMGEDEAAMTAFLTKASESCAELRQYYKDEFDAIPLDDEDE